MTSGDISRVIDDMLRTSRIYYQKIPTMVKELQKTILRKFNEYRSKEIDIYITASEAAAGIKKIIVLNRGKTEEKIAVRVPSGIQAGKKLRLKGKGVPGILGLPQGDILLKVHIKNR